MGVYVGAQCTQYAKIKMKFTNVLAAAGLASIASACSCAQIVQTGSWQDCQAVCASASSCYVWVWQSSYSNKCWMKGASGHTNVAEKGTVSGNKDGSIVLQDTNLANADVCVP